MQIQNNNLLELNKTMLTAANQKQIELAKQMIQSNLEIHFGNNPALGNMIDVTG